MSENLKVRVFESMVACEVEPGSEDAYLLRLVMAADKISALVKCEEELESGSKEFADAAASTRARIDELAAELPEVADYMREFFPSYGNTLDALLR
jgi:5'-deoxynucleotidase